MRKKFSIIIIPSTGGKTKTLTVSYLGARLILFVFICLIGGTVWLILNYGELYRKALEIKRLKQQNYELIERYKKVLTFEREFIEFKEKALQVAKMLGVEHTPESSVPELASSFNPGDSLYDRAANPGGIAKHGAQSLLEEEAEEQSFIPAIHPVRGWISRDFSAEHPALDFAAPEGTPIYCTMSGVVSFVGWDEWLGNLIEIKNNKGFKIVLGHLSRAVVQEGIQVRQGDLIGFVGSTGKSSAPHLHYEIWVNGIVQSPHSYLIE